MQGDVLEAILPTVGTCRPKGLPIWDPNRQMFILDEYESKSGNRSYKGVRITDRFMTVEYVGNYHTHTYINAIELYVYDGTELKLAGKKEFDKVHYNEQEIKMEQETLLGNFLQSQACLLKKTMDASLIKQKSKELIASSYLDLNSSNASHLLTLAIPLLPQNRYLEY